MILGVEKNQELLNLLGFTGQAGEGRGEAWLDQQSPFVQQTYINMRRNAGDSDYTRNVSAPVALFDQGGVQTVGQVEPLNEYQRGALESLAANPSSLVMDTPFNSGALDAFQSGLSVTPDASGYFDDGRSLISSAANTLDASLAVSPSANTNFSSGANALGEASTLAGLASRAPDASNFFNTSQTLLGEGVDGLRQIGAAVPGAGNYFNTSDNYMGDATSYFGAGAGSLNSSLGDLAASNPYIASGAEGINTAEVQTAMSAFEDPYKQQVMDAMISNLNRQGDIARNRIKSNLAGRKSFGDSSSAIQMAELDRNLIDVAGQQAANIGSQGYTQAMNNTMNMLSNNRNRQLQAAGAMQGNAQVGASIGSQQAQIGRDFANMGNTAFNRGMTGLTMQQGVADRMNQQGNNQANLGFSSLGAMNHSSSLMRGIGQDYLNQGNTTVNNMNNVAQLRAGIANNQNTVGFNSLNRLGDLARIGLEGNSAGLERQIINNGISRQNILDRLGAGDRIQLQNQTDLDVSNAERNRLYNYPTTQLNTLLNQLGQFPGASVTQQGISGGTNTLGRVAGLAGSLLGTNTNPTGAHAGNVHLPWLDRNIFGLNL